LWTSGASISDLFECQWIASPIRLCDMAHASDVDGGC
jgi:hypothetical protein